VFQRCCSSEKQREWKDIYKALRNCGQQELVTVDQKYLEFVWGGSRERIGERKRRKPRALAKVGGAVGFTRDSYEARRTRRFGLRKKKKEGCQRQGGGGNESGGGRGLHVLALNHILTAQVFLQVSGGEGKGLWRDQSVSRSAEKSESQKY